MGLFVHRLGNTKSYMIRQGQTLDRIVLLATAGQGADFYLDKDVGVVNTASAPLWLHVNATTVNDVFCSIELGIKFAAGTVFYAENMGGGNEAMLIFS